MFSDLMRKNGGMNSTTRTHQQRRRRAMPWNKKARIPSSKRHRAGRNRGGERDGPSYAHRLFAKGYAHRSAEGIVLAAPLGQTRSNPGTQTQAGRDSSAANCFAMQAGRYSGYLSGLNALELDCLTFAGCYKTQSQPSASSRALLLSAPPHRKESGLRSRPAGWRQPRTPGERRGAYLRTSRGGRAQDESGPSLLGWTVPTSHFHSGARDERRILENPLSRRSQIRLRRIESRARHRFDTRDQRTVGANVRRRMSACMDRRNWPILCNARQNQPQGASDLRWTAISRAKRPRPAGAQSRLWGNRSILPDETGGRLADPRSRCRLSWDWLQSRLDLVAASLAGNAPSSASDSILTRPTQQIRALTGGDHASQ